MPPGVYATLLIFIGIWFWAIFVNNAISGVNLDHSVFMRIKHW
jgi:hypothetical protein